MMSADVRALNPVIHAVRLSNDLNVHHNLPVFCDRPHRRRSKQR